MDQQRAELFGACINSIKNKEPVSIIQERFLRAAEAIIDFSVKHNRKRPDRAFVDATADYGDPGLMKRFLVTMFLDSFYEIGTIRTVPIAGREG